MWWQPNKWAFCLFCFGSSPWFSIDPLVTCIFAQWSIWLNETLPAACLITSPISTLLQILNFSQVPPSVYFFMSTCGAALFDCLSLMLISVLIGGRRSPGVRLGGVGIYPSRLTVSWKPAIRHAGWGGLFSLSRCCQNPNTHILSHALYLLHQNTYWKNRVEVEREKRENGIREEGVNKHFWT